MIIDIKNDKITNGMFKGYLVSRMINNSFVIYTITSEQEIGINKPQPIISFSIKKTRNDGLNEEDLIKKAIEFTALRAIQISRDKLVYIIPEKIITNSSSSIFDGIDLAHFKVLPRQLFINKNYVLSMLETLKTKAVNFVDQIEEKNVESFSRAISFYVSDFERHVQHCNEIQKSFDNSKKSIAQTVDSATTRQSNSYLNKEREF